MKVELQWKGKHKPSIEDNEGAFSTEIQEFITYKPSTLSNHSKLDNWMEKKASKNPKKGNQKDYGKKIRKTSISKTSITPKEYNRLIQGDNKQIMLRLLEEGYKNKIQLIYCDPPYATGDVFKIPLKIGGKKYHLKTKYNKFDQVAYNDKWENGFSSYLQMLYERLMLMKELLTDNGLIFIHVDYRAAAHVKLMMDEIFNAKNLVNEIIWCYKRWTAVSQSFQKCHDNILVYSKSKEYKFNTLFTSYADDEAHFTKKDEKGKYRWQYLKGKKYKLYLKKNGVRMGDWWNLNYLNSMAKERTNYPTQKPEELLERIIRTGTDEGDIVADFFCGSGTTGAVSDRLGRRWIMTDQSKFAINTAKKRILNIPNYSNKPYTLKNPYSVEFLVDLRGDTKIKNQLNPNKQDLGGLGRIKNYNLNKYEVPQFKRNHLEVQARKLKEGNIEINLVRFSFENRKYIPEKVKEAVSSDLDYIDHWSVDFLPIKGKDFFEVMWCSFRMRNKNDLKMQAKADKGNFNEEKVCIKVVDVFGNVQFKTLAL